ncbi:unnamed protein product [Arabis nemorensis]|uniref:Bidirectional sugar transporter SWEET n=1 Tax=Arabis nemorensis TaxID=586526 RepID=A0A565B4W7_9BRAS|nr:unnamed protein product [Arabis nemorensis]
MTNAKDIHMILGIIGTVISSLISLAPMPRFIEIYKKKSVEDGYQPQRHIAMIMKCTLWIIYGLPLVHKDNILVTITNGISLGIEVIYLVIYYMYCDHKAWRDNIRVSLLYWISFVQYFAAVTHFLPRDGGRQIFIGGFSTALTIIIHAVFAFVKTLEVEDKQIFQCMPLGLSFVSFINAAIWTAYSLIYQIDIYVLVCNGLGTLACASQIIVNVYYLLYTPTVNAIEPVNVDIDE